MSRTDPRPHYGTYVRHRADGYVDVWCPGHPVARADGYALQHRVVAYDAGILTDPSLHVHHVNGDKADNRVENLEAIGASEHQSQHHANAGGWAARNAAKTECVHGHPLSGDNLLASALPRRVCRRCNNTRGSRVKGG